MKKVLMLATVAFLVVFSSFALAAEDCNWLCQVVDWFSGTENVAGEAGTTSTTLASVPQELTIVLGIDPDAELKLSHFRGCSVSLEAQRDNLQPQVDAIPQKESQYSDVPDTIRTVKDYFNTYYASTKRRPVLDEIRTEFPFLYDTDQLLEINLLYDNYLAEKKMEEINRQISVVQDYNPDLPESKSWSQATPEEAQVLYSAVNFGESSAKPYDSVLLNNLYDRIKEPEGSFPLTYNGVDYFEGRKFTKYTDEGGAVYYSDGTRLYSSTDGSSVLEPIGIVNPTFGTVQKAKIEGVQGVSVNSKNTFTTELTCLVKSSCTIASTVLGTTDLVDQNAAPPKLNIGADVYEPFWVGAGESSKSYCKGGCWDYCKGSSCSSIAAGKVHANIGSNKVITINTDVSIPPAEVVPRTSEVVTLGYNYAENPSLHASQVVQKEFSDAYNSPEKYDVTIDGQSVILIQNQDGSKDYYTYDQLMDSGVLLNPVQLKPNAQRVLMTADVPIVVKPKIVTPVEPRAPTASVASVPVSLSIGDVELNNRDRITLRDTDWIDEEQTYEVRGDKLYKINADGSTGDEVSADQVANIINVNGDRAEEMEITRSGLKGTTLAVPAAVVPTLRNIEPVVAPVAAQSPVTKF